MAEAKNWGMLPLVSYSQDDLDPWKTRGEEVAGDKLNWPNRNLNKEHALCLAPAPLLGGRQPRITQHSISSSDLPRPWAKPLAPTWWCLWFGNKYQGLAGLGTSSEITGGSVDVRDFAFSSGDAHL